LRVGKKSDNISVEFLAIGHAPFSHAGEELMTLLPESHKRY